MSWKCDKCEKTFENEDIPEKCPECNSEDGTFSLVDKESKNE
ncbi:MAG: hydrogenase maturation nickel metallochaperone HypA [Candidatus Lokiarchaeota archaeon]|nr:hydrogenase maturation nickel metallochaperone HypA [Candidatus Lokiarchaeota archaeon]